MGTPACARGAEPRAHAVTHTTTGAKTGRAVHET